jgi:hypothetical protein
MGKKMGRLAALLAAILVITVLIPAGSVQAAKKTKTTAVAATPSVLVPFSMQSEADLAKAGDVITFIPGALNVVTYNSGSGNNYYFNGKQWVEDTLTETGAAYIAKTALPAGMYQFTMQGAPFKTGELYYVLYNIVSAYNDKEEPAYSTPAHNSVMIIDYGPAKGGTTNFYANVTPVKAGDQIQVSTGAIMHDYCYHAAMDDGTVPDGLYIDVPTSPSWSDGMNGGMTELSFTYEGKTPLYVKAVVGRTLVLTKTAPKK